MWNKIILPPRTITLLPKQRVTSQELHDSLSKTDDFGEVEVKQKIQWMWINRRGTNKTDWKTLFGITFFEICFFGSRI